ncbi:hypothetical protein LSH36_161g03014 [Paralvinella palmiformis]|uniref:SAP domain-containing protein n=1 Tax=Paralvinella palmiformis TaxID=53620 RepID=A0AAD9JTN1_9ANNE|nr:hypothetical protein LSH36_161g03014 [Paralvinella palmiformis]
MANKDIGEMTIPELKGELRRRKAKLDGRKADLVEKHESYVLNEDFVQEPIVDSFVMSTPDLLSYRDINSESAFPSLSEESITVYMQLFDADMSSKPEDMCQSRFLRSIRIAKYGADTFVCGTVCAEMRSKGRRRDYMFRNLYTEAADISSCDKTHWRFPVEMERLRLRSGGSLHRVLDLDLSPVDDMPDAEYEDLFRNVIINMNVPEMSMLTMHPPANIHAVVHDHHYLEKDHETYIHTTPTDHINFTQTILGAYVQPHKQHTLSS